MKIVLFLLSLLLPFSVFAGGGRIEIENFNGTGLTGSSGLYIQARIYSQDHSRTIAGEKAAFQIQNPRSGDRCITSNEISSEYGQIFGQCFAEEPGTITVYVHSSTNGDNSSVYLLHFITLSTQSTRQPTRQPTQIPSSVIQKKPTIFISPTPTKQIELPIITSTPTLSPSVTQSPTLNNEKGIESDKSMFVRLIKIIENFFVNLFHVK
jgi:hypothetical protein